MSNKLVVAILMASLLSPVVSAEGSNKSGKRITYKCHVALQDKSEVVHEFVTVDEEQKEFELGLKGRMVFFADGVSGSKIEKLYECVKMKARFKSSAARDLEAKTPF